MQWLTLHLNLASLSYSSRLLLVLSISAAALWLLLSAGLQLVANWAADAGSTGWTANWLNSKHIAPRGRQLVNRWLPIASAAIAGYILGAASLFSPVRELHMVEVLTSDAPRVWTVNVPSFFNPPLAADMRMTLRLCPHGDDLPLRPGMIMEPFQYIQANDCLLINSSTYVDYYRDQAHNVIDKYGNQLFAKEHVQ
jgi:hypothetical protein